MRLTVQLVSIMVFVQWAQAGTVTTTTDSPSRKQYKERMRKLIFAEAYTNCTCPRDSPIDTKRELCGWEILERTGPSNACENHTVYRCMDPDPWKAIDHVPCAHYGKRNSDKTHQRCAMSDPGRIYYRQCVA
jgi:hypothetical protein